ncbi:MAG: hypothetical protein WCA13_15940 [Terriglobales bacterium]
MPTNPMPLGVAELCFRGRNACPVRGCVEASPCPTHHIAVHSTRGGHTYIYDDRYRNLLWADTNDRLHLEAILRGKRESRMGYEHSEDAVTWNVFRFFERHECLAPAMRTICPRPESEPLTIFWTTHEDRLWEPYRLCSDQIPEKATARSESDLILLWEHKLLVIVEAKFRSPNRSDKAKREDELRKSRPYIAHASRYLNREGAEDAVRCGWYELLRNWALGTTLKDTLGCEAFVLVNLVRKRHEKEHGENPRRDFAESACALTPDSRFVVAYWEDLVAAAPSICDHPNSGLLVKWAKNKSELLGKPAFEF